MDVLEFAPCWFLKQEMFENMKATEAKKTLCRTDET